MTKEWQEATNEYAKVRNPLRFPDISQYLYNASRTTANHSTSPTEREDGSSHWYQQRRLHWQGPRPERPCQAIDANGCACLTRTREYSRSIEKVTWKQVRVSHMRVCLRRMYLLLLGYIFTLCNTKSNVLMESESKTFCIFSSLNYARCWLLCFYHSHIFVAVNYILRPTSVPCLPVFKVLS